MKAPRITLGGKFLLAVCPFLITSTIGTAVYLQALHTGEAAFEQAISNEATLDEAARKAANLAIRVGLSTLAFLRHPGEMERADFEQARAAYWRAKASFDQKQTDTGMADRGAPLSQAFEKFATLAQSVIVRWDESQPARLAAPDAAAAAQVAQAAKEAIEADLDEIVRLNHKLGDLLDENLASSEDLASAKRMALIAAQQGITNIWIAAFFQCLVGVGAILLLGRNVRSRIELIARGTRALAHGNLTTRVRESGRDELTELARHFNEMATRLERTTVSRTELEDREAALRLSEQRLRLLVEQLKDCAIFMLGEEGEITSWNAGAARLYGYSEAEAMGAPLQSLYAESADPPADQHLALARRGGGLAFDDQQRRKDGTPFWAEVSITPLGSVKRFAAYVVLVRDVTVQRAADLERQRHLDQLTHVSRLSVMGEMAAGFAHELNQPLGAISNYAEGCLIRMVDGALPTETLQQILERISSEAQRAGDIIHRVRAFARKEDSRVEAVDLAAAIQHVAALLDHEATHQGVDLHIEVAKDLPIFAGDRVQIEQVLVNLIRNSFDALRDLPDSSGGGQVLVRAGRNELGDVQISVEDTGGGIAPDMETKLFDAFYTTKADGLGLGLAISRTIVESHGGRIWAASNSSGGLTAHITIPARRPPDVA